MRSKSQEILEVGECTAGEKGSTLQSLHSTLQGKPGQISVAICSADLPDVLSFVEGSLAEAGRPHVIVYAGQPEQVTFRPMLCALLVMLQFPIFWVVQPLGAVACSISINLLQALERPPARSLKSTDPSNAKDLCDRKCRIQASQLDLEAVLTLIISVYDLCP